MPKFMPLGKDDKCVGCGVELAATEQGVHEGMMRRIPAADEPAFIGLS